MALEEKTGSKRQVNENSDGEDQEKQYINIAKILRLPETKERKTITIKKASFYNFHMHGGRDELFHTIVIN